MKIVLLFVFLSALFDGSSSQSYKFIYVPSLMKWSDAQMYCRYYYTDLATIKNQTDFDNVVAFGGTQWVWIGLHRTTTDNLWHWSDDSQITFSRWAAGQPSLYTLNVDGCASASTEGWFDVPCTYFYPFVCYMESSQISLNTSSVNNTGVEQHHQDYQGMKKRHILRLKVKSDQNVNDPEVMTEVLQKLKQILKMKGLDEYDTLSWKKQSDGNVFQKYQKRRVPKQPCQDAS